MGSSEDRQLRTRYRVFYFGSTLLFVRAAILVSPSRTSLDERTRPIRMTTPARAVHPRHEVLIAARNP